jgi:hypothetical protein
LAISREAEVSVRFSIGDSLAEKILFSAWSIPPRGMATGSRVAEGEEQRDLALEAVVSSRHSRQPPTRMSGEPNFTVEEGGEIEMDGSGREEASDGDGRGNGASP